MSEHGVTEKGFVIKRLDEILEEMHTELSEAYGFNTRLDEQSFFNVMITNLAGKFSEFWEVAQDIYYAKNPATAEGINLDNAVQYGGIRRATNQYSYYKLHCKGEDGTVVRKGTVVATNTAPQVKLNSVSEFDITREHFNQVEIRLAAEQSGAIYSVSINGTQYSYMSQTKEVVSILQGLANTITAEEYEITVDKEKMILSIVDKVVSRSNVLLLSDNLTTASVTVLAEFATNEYGKWVLPNGTITVMITNVSGLESVENRLTPIYGRLQETDVELRHSYLAKSTIRSTRMVDSICSQLINDVANVESARGYENETDKVDAQGRPPHSIEIIVDGGDEVEIASIILNKKAAGIQTVGGVKVEIATQYGHLVPIRFNRPEYVYVWMKVVLDANKQYLPANYANLTINAIVAKASAFKAGESMLSQILNEDIYKTVSGITYVDIKCATTTEKDYIPMEEEYTKINVSVTDRQKIVIDETRIEVVYSGHL